jgi:hypothetical protein
MKLRSEGGYGLMYDPKSRKCGRGESRKHTPRNHHENDYLLLNLVSLAASVLMPLHGGVSCFKPLSNVTECEFIWKHPYVKVKAS